MTVLRRPTTQSADVGQPEYDFDEEVLQTLAAIGVQLPRQPSTAIPDLPEDITTLTSRDVGRLLTELAGWLAYLRTESARRKAGVAARKANVEMARKLGKPAVEIAALTLDVVRAGAMADVVEGLVASIRIKRDAVSREIARLGLDVEPSLQQTRRAYRPSND